MKLSILIPTIHTRRNTFLPRILEQVYSQYNKLTQEEQSEVEILVMMDNKTVILGDKRNAMILQAKGKYIVFVDDDDRIADDYIKTILDATNENKDTITFNAEVSINGENPKMCYYGNEYSKDKNANDCYYRIPNHICVVKKSIAEKVKFPSILFQEDVAYSLKLKPLLKTETNIQKTLYYYDFNQETTETQISTKNKDNYIKPKTDIPAILDLIILSNAKATEFKEMTENTIKTALENSKGYNVNIMVMEQKEYIDYKNATTIHYEGEFNYNAVANLGINEGKAPYIMVANNDLLFRKDWLFHLLKANHPVVSPKCPVDGRQKGINENTLGFTIAKHFSGWCFMMKRSVWKDIKGLDEDFGFWFADNATVKQLEAKGYTPMIVPLALVEHLGSKTLNSLPRDEKRALTFDLVNKYNKKYKENLFVK